MKSKFFFCYVCHVRRILRFSYLIKIESVLIRIYFNSDLKFYIFIDNNQLIGKDNVLSTSKETCTQQNEPVKEEQIQPKKQKQPKKQSHSNDPNPIIKTPDDPQKQSKGNILIAIILSCV